MRLVLRLTFLLSFLFAAAGPASAQEIDARININYKKIQGSSTSVFETLKTALTEFINERQWTTLQFKRNERINCNFNITVNAYDEAANSFECALMVQSNRPVFNSNYTTTVFSTNDPNFNFNYQEYDQIEFRSDILDNNLTAVIAYYVYLMIGMDLDTMSPLGGTEVLKMAQNIVNNAQSLEYKGWKAFEDSKNRHAIITDMLDGGMEPFRRMQYKYYREGLDVMAENAERGRAGITAAMELLQKARENKSMSMLPELFTEYKRDELVSIYNKEKANAQERLTVSEILSRINPSQNSYWRKMK